MKKIIISLLLVCCFHTMAQKVTLKTNALYWATLSPNIGTEIRLGNRSTLDVSGMMNLFVFKDNRKYNFLAIQPEYRYWFCQSFSQHFVGAHIHYANYNAGLEKYRYNGNLYGAGLSYGYQWYLSPRWNLEATIGGGYIYMDHDVYYRPKCGKLLGQQTRNYWGLTKIGISVIYIIK